MFYSFDKSSIVTAKNEIQQFKKLVKKYISDISFYKSLILTDEATPNHKIVNVGDAVLVASEGYDFFVAKVEAFFAAGDLKTEEKSAIVSWFFKQDEIPKTKLPLSLLKNEIFLCSANVHGTIDAETIVDTCSIIFEFASAKDSVENVYYCRKSFDGKKFKEITNSFPNILDKKFSRSTKKKANVNESQKSLLSTLVPKQKCSRPHLSSPVSASGFGRVDANAVAQDILEFDSDNSDDDREHLNEKKNERRKTILSAKENIQTSLTTTPKKVESHLLRKRNKSTTTKSLKSDLSLQIMPSEVRVSIKRMEKNVVSKENDFSLTSVRRSRRLSKKTDFKKSRTQLHGTAEPVSKSITSDCESDSSESVDDDGNDASFDEKAAAKHNDSSDSELEFSSTPPPRRKLATKPNLTRSVNEKSSRSRTRRSLVEKSRIKTPKKRRPFIPDRKTPLKLAANDFEEARQRLHVSAVPDSLPCREEEFQTIYSFIEGKIKAGTGGCMYISGVPGTGKTATVMEVLSCLRQSVAENLLEDFDYVDVNGMRLTEPRQAYVSILNQLKGVRATSEQASELLAKHFNMRGRRPTLLVVDELDLLWTRKQDVLYHIFDWPSHRHARLIVVAIANTMDLPERIMMSKVSSRLGLTRLSFLPYNFKQLQEIITSRLHGLPVFEPDAVQLVARKVAAVSGDARRCLDVCRRAIEIADQSRRSNSSLKAASIDQVHEAIQEMFASPVITLLRNCSVHEKLFLRSVVAEFRRSGLEEATLGQVLQHHSTMAQVEGLPSSSVASIVKVCNHLSSCRLLLLETVTHDLYARLRLNISVDDVLFALNTD